MDQELTYQRVLEEFESIISQEYPEIASRFPNDRAPIGFFCPYVPEELLHAAGALPFRLLGRAMRMSHVQAHLPSNCCHLAKSSLESLLQGKLRFLRGIIFSHTCDTMQGLADIWALQKKIPLQFNLMIPTRLDSNDSHSYLKAEMERLKSFLESHVGKITPENLKASIQLFNRIREKIQEIYHYRRKWHGAISETDFARIIQAGYLMDRPQYLERLNDLIHALPEKREERKSLIPVFLVGNIPHSESYFSLIDEVGATVVQDDLCSGSRFFRLMVSEDMDPMEGLTHRYLASYMCPTKYKGPLAHVETLLKEVEDSEAKGVIFLFYKYCEPHFFDYPDLKQALESKGFSTLLLEVEDPSYSVEQLKIRIQAFVEMLSPF